MSPTSSISTLPLLLQATCAFSTNGDWSEQETEIAFHPLGEKPKVFATTLPLFDGEFDLQLDTSNPPEQGYFVSAPPGPCFTMPVWGGEDAPDWFGTQQVMVEMDDVKTRLLYVFVPIRKCNRYNIERLSDMLGSGLLARRATETEDKPPHPFDTLLKHMHALVIHLGNPEDMNPVPVHSLLELLAHKASR